MRIWRLLGVMTFVAVVALTAATASARPSASSAACGKLQPPTSGVYFGMMHPQEWQSPNPVRLKILEQKTGVAARFATFTIPWGNRLAFPSGVQELWRAGFVPWLRVFNFQTFDYDPAAPPKSRWPGPYSWSRIAAGEYDDQIRAFADAARNTDIPILFTIGTEVNNDHPWSGRFNGGSATLFGDPSWPDGPEHFRDAYRHWVDIFRQEGATNVTFFFQVDTVFGYAAGSFTEPSEQYHWYYPGDDVVDWMSLSLYSAPNKPDGSNESFEEKLATFHAPDYVGSYNALAQLGPRPIALAELGFNRMPSEAAKAAWVRDAAAVMQSGRYPRIAAVNWWGDDNPGPWYGDPSSSPELASAFHAAFAQPYFQAVPTFSGDCQPLTPANVRRTGATLHWTAVPNAASYEVFRGSKRIGRTAAATFGVWMPGTYRVRGVNLIGPGPFGQTR